MSLPKKETKTEEIKIESKINQSSSGGGWGGRHPTMIEDGLNYALSLLIESEMASGCELMDTAKTIQYRSFIPTILMDGGNEQKNEKREAIL